MKKKFSFRQASLDGTAPLPGLPSLEGRGLGRVKNWGGCYLIRRKT